MPITRPITLQLIIIPDFPSPPMSIIGCCSLLSSRAARGLTPPSPKILDDVSVENDKRVVASISTISIETE